MNASLRNCLECGRLFAYMGRNICPKCLDKEEELYMTVRKYVRDHPGAAILEVNEATGIAEEKILQFLRDGRLQSRGFKGALECEQCGKMINAGRYCQDCLLKMDAQIRGEDPKNPKQHLERTSNSDINRNRMHIKDKF